MVCLTRDPHNVLVTATTMLDNVQRFEGVLVYSHCYISSHGAPVVGLFRLFRSASWC